MELNDFRLTDLTIDAVCPDKWNKMRVHHAKAVFSNKTCSQAVSACSEELRCESEIEKVELTDTDIASGGCIETKRANFLMEKCLESDDISMFLKSDISCLQFWVYIGGLYNNLFMQKDTNINRKDISLIEQRIR